MPLFCNDLQFLPSLSAPVPLLLYLPHHLHTHSPATARTSVQLRQSLLMLMSVGCSTLLLHLRDTSQGCHWTFAKITENLRVRAVSQKMNTKRDRKSIKRKMKKEKIENNGKRETDRRRTDRAKNNGGKKKSENNGKSASLRSA